MTYPSPDDVDTATHEQLARWHRFLPSPGLSHHAAFERGDIAAEDVHAAINIQARTLVRIDARLRMLGGITPALSKRIGWKE